MTLQTLKRMVLVAALAAAVALSGCSTLTEAEKRIDKTSAQSEELLRHPPELAPTIVVSNDVWVSAEEAPASMLDPLPEAFGKATPISADQIPFELVAQALSAGQRTVFGSAVNKRKPVTLVHRGTVASALDALAATSGYSWRYNQGTIYWWDLETRVWFVPAAPGRTGFLTQVTGSATTTQSGQSSSASPSADPNASANAGNHGMSVQQSTRVADPYSIWDDLGQQIRAMLSPRGTVNISQSTSTLMVRDYPDRLQEIDGVVKELINELMRQVTIEVSVIEVTLADSSSYGIDWSLVKDNLSGLGFALSTTSSQAVFPQAGATSPVFTMSYTKADSKWDASKALIRALETQGNASIMTQPRVVTLNNQVAAIQVGREKGYLASSTIAPTGTTGTVQTSLIPGLARDGFIMSVLPRISRREVVLQMSVSVNQLISIDRREAGGTAIEVPEIVTKNFSQISRLRTGEAMIMAGFRQSSGERSHEGLPFLNWLGGAISAKTGRVDTVVVITPYIQG